MKRRIFIPPAYQLALGALLTGVVFGCTNEEATHMKEIAGTYAMKSTDRFANSLLDGSTMTLDADGTWRSAGIRSSAYAMSRPPRSPRRSPASSRRAVGSARSTPACAEGRIACSTMRELPVGYCAEVEMDDGDRIGE